MLGDLLRDKRKELNLTLEDVEKATNIRKLYLTALEKGEYDKLPKAEVFCKGFIKSYGKFLNLNTDDLIQQYQAEKNQYQTVADTAKEVDDITPTPVQEQAVVTKTISSSTEKSVTTSDKTKKRTQLSDFANHQKFMETKTINKKKLIAIITGVILILILIVAIISNFNSSPKETSTTNTTQTVEETQKTSPLTIEGTFAKDTWTVVTIDGKEVLAKIVPKGTTLTWDGTKNITILAKDPQTLSIKVNGGESHPLSTKDQELTVVFSLDNNEVKTEEIIKQNTVTKPEEKTETQTQSQQETKPQPVEKKVIKPEVPKQKAQPAPAPKTEPTKKDVAPPTKESPSANKAES